MFNIVGVIEYNSAVWNPESLDVDYVRAIIISMGPLANYCHAYEIETVDATSFMEKKCDVLIFAAK